MNLTVTHCITSIDVSTGGPAEYIRLLLNKMCTNENIHLRLETVECDLPIKLNDKIKFFFHLSNKIGYSKTVISNLEKSNTDIFHGNGLWGIFVHQMVMFSRFKNKPYVLSLHGCLDPISLNNKAYWKKYIALKLYQDKDLKLATCLHATAKMEMVNVRLLGYSNPIAIIPNGIELQEYPLKDYNAIKKIKKVLFLSRIHPQKGIELLLGVWEKLDPCLRNSWQLEIAGTGNPSYIKYLKQLIIDKSLQRQVFIVGSKFGDDKIAIYQSADLFVLPSYSENFGIVVAEALATGVPVITTFATPWEDLELYNAGKWIPVGENPLKDALESLMCKTDEEREIMGKNGRRLIEEKYSIESVAERFVLLYQWILTGENKPDFIYE